MRAPGVWYLQGDWPHLGLLAGGLLAVGGLALLLHRLGLFASHPPHDGRLVQERISRPAYLAQVRLAVFAPADAPRAAVDERLRQLGAAYRQYDLAAGNGLVARPLRRLPGGGAGAAAALARPDLLPTGRCVPVLNTRELASLWHLPQQAADVPLVERTAARERLPLPCTVGEACRIGESTHQGRAVPVRLPDALLARHLLLVGKTRKGKSSVLSHIARHLMDQPVGGGRRPALVLVDPHRVLARAVLGMVPALLADGDFRRAVLKSVKDPIVRTGWRTYYEPLDRRLQLDIINPVQRNVCGGHGVFPASPAGAAPASHPSLLGAPGSSACRATYVAPADDLTGTDRPCGIT